MGRYYLFSITVYQRNVWGEIILFSITVYQRNVWGEIIYLALQYIRGMCGEKFCTAVW